jgi:hypothetical protein
VLSFGVHGLPRYFVNQSVNTFKKLIAMYYPQSVCEHLNVRTVVKTP